MVSTCEEREEAANDSAATTSTVLCRLIGTAANLLLAIQRDKKKGKHPMTNTLGETRPHTSALQPRGYSHCEYRFHGVHVASVRGLRRVLLATGVKENQQVPLQVPECLVAMTLQLVGNDVQIYGE